MKNYTSAEPVFSENISIVEADDLVNDENNNAAAKQLLQNTLVLKKKTDKLNTDLGGLKLVTMTQTEYNALTVKDPNTLYFTT